jgi:hypothetical protein
MRRMLLFTAILAVAAGAAAVWAVAQGDPGPPTVTGCLGSNGDLTEFAVGATPAKECKQTDTQVQLSGGDITSVVAGAGLEGGAASGAAAVGISPTFRLPQNCANGDTPRWSDGQWACGSGTTYVVFRRVRFVVTATQPAPPQLVMTLQLPAGQYLVSIHVLAAIVSDPPGSGSFSHLRCNTSPSVGAPSTGLILTDLNLGNTNGSTGSGTLSGTSPMTVADGASVQLFCVNLGGRFGTLPAVHWALMNATPIGPTAPVQEDTTTG